MNKMLNLPVGNSSFEVIRRNNLLYVDKTRHIFNLVSEGMYYFMSRPRRFGKSLMISTLLNLFQGKKDLFGGLWIAENTDWEWKEHPVILIDFNSINNNTPDELTGSLQRTLEKSAEKYGLTSDAPFLKNQFKELILALHRKTGMPVVILIDEYDKPLIDHLGIGEEALDIAKDNRRILKSFFGVIKDGEAASVLRFVFITGVSKFSRVSIFSELNNLNDITMNRHYAEMLGYTQDEMENCFTSHIEKCAEECGKQPEGIIKKLKSYYNGYRFSEKDVRVYNPFSVLKSLSEQAFKFYWFETATPTFLVNLLRQTGFHLPRIENMRAIESVFSTYDLDDLKPEALLFQAGYVTIKNIRGRLYTFSYPNREVKTAFLDCLLYSFIKDTSDRSRFVLLAEYLYADDLDAFIGTAKAIFASIPYELEKKNKLDEAYFHTLFYLMVSASGIDADNEVLTSEGRIDMVMEFPDKVYVIEFKCNRSAEKALKQIREKNYAERYRQRDKKIILLGINFDTEKRNITDWKPAEDEG